MSAIALGPLVIRADILVFLISAITGFIVLKMRLRGREESGWIMDTYVNALIIGFVVWKFSIIIFDPVRTIQNPLSLLYFTGGDKGILLGTALALLYIGIRLNKKRSWVIPLAKASVLAFVTTSFIKYILLWLLDDALGMIGVMYILFYGFFSVWVWMKYDASIRVFGSFILWYSIGSVFIPFFDQDRYAVVAGFSAVQIAFGIIAIAVLIVDMIIGKPQQHKNG